MFQMKPMQMMGLRIWESFTKIKWLTQKSIGNIKKKYGIPNNNILAFISFLTDLYSFWKLHIILIVNFVLLKFTRNKLYFVEQFRIFLGYEFRRIDLSIAI